ncbi:hypothetical protein HispidOSU_009340, partial [Sigmodon hispidus]
VFEGDELVWENRQETGFNCIRWGEKKGAMATELREHWVIVTETLRSMKKDNHWHSMMKTSQGASEKAFCDIRERAAIIKGHPDTHDMAVYVSFE